MFSYCRARPPFFAFQACDLQSRLLTDLSLTRRARTTWTSTESPWTPSDPTSLTSPGAKRRSRRSTGEDKLRACLPTRTSTGVRPSAIVSTGSRTLRPTRVRLRYSFRARLGRVGLRVENDRLIWQRSGLMSNWWEDRCSVTESSSSSRPLRQQSSSTSTDEHLLVVR